MLTYAFIVSVLLMLGESWDATEDLISEEKKEESIIYPKVAAIAPLILPYILDEVDEFRNSEDPESEDPR